MEIIGVDVGNGYTKTVNSCFVSAVKDYGNLKPAIMDKTVMWDGNYYTVGGTRSRTKTDIKTDNTALILALAGIGEECKARGISPDEIVLSEGLPLERCVAENKVIDERYYRKGKTIYFEYEDVPYNIHIKDVVVNPQCVAGAIDLINDGCLPPVCLLVDIGSWTVDILPIQDNRPMSSESRSLLNGVIHCMLSCNEEIRRRTGREVLESQIQKVMMGKSGQLPASHENIIRNATRKYVKDLADTLVENSYNIDTLTCIFMGGGAVVARNYGMDLFPMAKYITDIRANAVGYEKIAKTKYNGR